MPVSKGIARPSLWGRGALYARTLAHLHPAQLLFRPVHVARSALLSRSPALAARLAGDTTPGLGAPLLALDGAIPGGVSGLDSELTRARRALQGSQLLVGVSVPLAPPATAFEAQLPKLVLYQQAYLGVARSLAIAARTEGFEQAREAVVLAIEHIREFIERVPPGRGAAWDPYPVATRLMNLLVARELLVPVADRSGLELLNGALLKSLGQHARWLAATLEVHLLGNHLFTDGAALFLAGCALETSGSVAWRALGYGILTRSLAIDVLPDGGHAERSPMYAAIYLDQLELVLAAARSMGVPPPAGAVASVVALSRFLLETAHPDGEIPLLGDSAFDEAPLPADLAGPAGLSPASLRLSLYGAVATPAAATGERTPRAPGEFPETGITAIRSGNSLLVFDSGPLGTTDQPGHAHADALSFELSHDGRRLVTDAGAGHYEADEARSYFRGPLAHSSVSVDGRGSDEVWASWRAGRRAEVEPAVQSIVDGVHVLRASVRTPWGWQQERLLVYAPGELLCVVDRVQGAPRSASVVSHLHLAPDVSVESGEDAEADVTAWGASFRLTRLLGSGWTTHRGEHDPFRGYTAFRMGVFEPSTEVDIQGIESDGAWGAAYALLLLPEVEASSSGTGIRLRLANREIVISFDHGALRWELLRTPRASEGVNPAS